MTKLLLTSNGLSNDSIKKAFLDLVGKPANDIKVAFIPTAGLADGGDKEWLINDMHRIRSLGCYVDVVDIAQLTKDEWLPRIDVCDVIFVGGGNTFYLSYWMQQSGLFDMLPELLKTKVYAGISAGSIVTGTSLTLTSQAIKNPQAFEDEQYELFGPTGRSSAKSLNFVDFVFRSHFNSRFFFMVNKDELEKRAKEIGQVVYALDDDSALKVIDGKVTEVITEGEWLKVDPKEAGN